MQKRKLKNQAMKVDSTNIDRDIEDNIRALAEGRIELEKETEIVVKAQKLLIERVEINDLVIRENMERIAEIDKMFE